MSDTTSGAKGTPQSGEGEPSVQTIPIEAVAEDERNARKHNDRNRDAIKRSLDAFGAGRSIVLDGDNVVRAGNGTIEQARASGFTEIVVVEPKPGQLVAVRRPEWSDAQAVGYGIADNRSAEFAEWDEEALAVAVENLDEIDVADVGFTLEELAELTGAEPPPLADPPAPEPLADSKTQRGDLITLGRHRVMCGDSTSAEDVGALLAGEKPGLMVTDPPYGVSYNPVWRDEVAEAGSSIGSWGANRRNGKVANDDRVDWREAWDLSGVTVAYVWHAPTFLGEVKLSLEASRFEVRSSIVWVKPRFAISRGHYNWQHEACVYAVLKGQTSKWAGDHSQSTVWAITNVLTDSEGKTDHGTQKPIECMARPIRNHGHPQVYDPFLGSGTTLIAADQLDRTCYGVELEPRYVDVIVRRWIAHCEAAGKDAEVVGWRGDA